MELNEENEQFRQIQIACVDLAKEVNLKNVRQMRDVVEKYSPEIFENFFAYVLFSVRLALKRLRNEKIQDVQDETKIALIKTIRILFIEKCTDWSKTNISSLVVDLISDLIISINLPGTNDLIGSTELQNCVVSFLSKIFEKTTLNENASSVKTLLVSMKFRPILAHCVSVLLKLLKTTDTSTSFENGFFNYANCLTAVLQLNDSVAASFLPGISSVLLDLLTNFELKLDEFSNKKCQTLFETLTLAIMLSARDESNQTLEWRRNASLQLKHLTERLSSIFVCSSFAKPKLCLLKFVETILVAKTATILSDCKRRCLEILATFVFDDDQIVAANNETSSRMETISKEFRTEFCANLTSICWRLPRMSKTSTFDVQQRIEWQQLCGCLKLLNASKSLTYFFLNDCQSKLFCRSFCEAVRLNDVIVAEINLQVDLKMTTTNMDFYDSSPWVTLQQPSDAKAQKLIYTSFELICEIPEIDVILENFYDIFRSKPDWKWSSAFALNGILNALAKTSKAGCAATVSVEFLETLLNDYFIWLNNVEEDKAVSELNTNLALHGVTVISRILPRTEMQSYLVRTLYCLLRLFYFPSSKQNAFNALNIIAFGLEKRDGKHLLLENLDYLASSIVSKLKHLSLYADTPSVLSSLLELIDLNDISLISGAMLECLANVDRCKEQDHALPVLITCLEKFSRLCKDLPVLIDSKQKRSDDDNEENPKLIPWHVTFATNCMHSLHCWLGAKCFKVRMASVQALRETLYCLKCYEDQLLPAIHKCWPSVLARFNDEEIQSRLCGFEIIFAMAELSRDFVRRRIETDAWPLVEKFMQKNANKSRCAGVAYRQSATYRLQYNICNTLGDLCGRIKASDEMVAKCKTLLEFYTTDKQQPQHLLEAASKSIDLLCQQMK